MPPAPPHVMLIDDDAAVLEMVNEALTMHGMVVHAFGDARKALAFLESEEAPPFDLVISDINMEGTDGFDVIHRVKTINPNLPVVLMTGQATLEYAIRALRMGAANLFQKPLALREMVKAVFHLVDLYRDFRLAQVGLRGLVLETRHFSFRCSELDVPSLVRHLTDRLVPMGFARNTNLDVIAMAFHEALVNALEHGNLELDSALKPDSFTLDDPYGELRAQRLADPAFGSRKVDVRVEATPEHFLVLLTDEGPGFDTRRVSRISEDTLSRQFGRGLAMIHMVMDEVTHNERGNQIRMVLRRKEVV